MRKLALEISKAACVSGVLLTMAVPNASATTVTVVATSTQGAGNTADVYAGSYGAFVPFGASFRRRSVCECPAGKYAQRLPNARSITRRCRRPEIIFP